MLELMEAGGGDLSYLFSYLLKLFIKVIIKVISKPKILPWQSFGGWGGNEGLIKKIFSKINPKPILNWLWRKLKANI